MSTAIPANILEFEQLYKSEGACREALFKMRWPNGFICPKCGKDKGWQRRERLLIECAGCGYQASVTAGTMFHGFKLPLSTIFRIVYHVVAEKSGTNCCALSRQFGISYNAAAVWRRKVRDTMVRTGRTPLQGIVEIDEFKLGGPAEGCCGRKIGDNQALVLAMVEEAKPGVCGRIRLEYIPDATRETLTAVIKTQVASGSTIKTDGLRSYNDLAEQGFSHKATVLSKPKKAHEELPLVHRVASLFKRFILGVLQGTWTYIWLQSVLDEFVFRFNRRNSTHRPLLFNRLLEEGLLRRPPTRKHFMRISAIAAQLTGVWL